jgi:predicted GIY-YIG superfamily endonuclease
VGGYRRHNYAEDIAGPTWLYRLFAGVNVAYIGVTNNPRFRFMRHRQRACWWTSVDRVQLTWFPTRAEAFAAERAAITAESPLHNRARPKVVA